MHVVVFKDRCGRVIRILFDDTGTQALAYRDDEMVGELRVDMDGGSTYTSATLVDLYVAPAYRRSGIAHTLLAYTSRELGQPIHVDRLMWPDSPACESLYRCLLHEGIIVAA